MEWGLNQLQYESFSPLTGIVFISTEIGYIDGKAEALWFQSPYGDCFYFYPDYKGTGYEVTYDETFQSPYGDCFYFYLMKEGKLLLPGLQDKFQSPYGDCFYFYLWLQLFCTTNIKPSFSPLTGIVFISTRIYSHVPLRCPQWFSPLTGIVFISTSSN